MVKRRFSRPTRVTTKKLPGAHARWRRRVPRRNGSIAASRVKANARAALAVLRRGHRQAFSGSARPLDLTVSRPPLQFRWADAISPQEWALYQRAIEALRGAGLNFMLGGGFALAAFTGRWRDTKDIDLYIHSRDREAAVEALARAGFGDYYNRLRYDGKWIYRSVRSDVIVDIIWSMANQRAQVDEAWFQRAVSLSVRGQSLRVIPPEEFMWCKLYILQRDHCDWTDIFNLLFAMGPQLDWNHLLARLEDDTPLLKAVLTVYGWLCPKEAGTLPKFLWRRLGMRAPAAPRRRPAHDRIRLLDSRCWFASLCSRGQKLEV